MIDATQKYTGDLFTTPPLKSQLSPPNPLTTQISATSLSVQDVFRSSSDIRNSQRSSDKLTTNSSNPTSAIATSGSSGGPTANMSAALPPLGEMDTSTTHHKTGEDTGTATGTATATTVTRTGTGMTQTGDHDLDTGTLGTTHVTASTFHDILGIERHLQLLEDDDHPVSVKFRQV